MRPGGVLGLVVLAAAGLVACSSSGGPAPVTGSPPSAFLPVKVGEQLDYRVVVSGKAPESEIRSVLSVTPEVGDFQIDVQSTVDAQNGESTYDLAPDGSFSDSLAALLGNGQTLHFSGSVAFPGPASCRPGVTRTSPASIADTQPGESETLTGTSVLRCGAEAEVTVPAGRFRARELDLEVTLGPAGHPFRLRERRYAMPGIGSVQDQVTLQTGTRTVTESAQLVHVSGAAPARA
ncbi:MAG: hypothetical protein J0H43_06315 [Actinobacteria bacterium]|nr:hypothetical protein [Actinomycetota bacterium]